MRAVILERQGEPLKTTTLPDPKPQPGQLLLNIGACGVCRTDLHLRDSEIEATKLPVVLGHQIVARTEDGRRVGVPWLGWTDGTCHYCTTQPREPVRQRALHRPRHRRRLRRADHRRRALLPPAARRAHRRGRGAAAVRRPDRLPRAHVHRRRDPPRPVRLRLGRPHDLPGRRLPGPRGLRLHAPERRTHPDIRAHPRRNVGRRQRRAPPEQLDAAIIFASAGELVPPALKALAPGGTVVCAGIHMSDIPSFSYDDLWQERSIRSVANLTRQDGEEFLALAPKVPVKTTITTYRARRRRAGAGRPAGRPVRGQCRDRSVNRLRSRSCP